MFVSYGRQLARKYKSFKMIVDPTTAQLFIASAIMYWAMMNIYYVVNGIN